MDRKIASIYRTLLKKFGNQNWWPVTDRENAEFEIIAGAILTQNTAWKNVEKAIKKLAENNLMSREAILAADKQKLARTIKSSGYHNQKAKKLKEFSKFKGEINRENLLSIWGIGEETADSIMLYAYNKPNFVIDNYTKRIFKRIGYDEDSYAGLQELFTKNLPRDAKTYQEYHALLVELGKNYCKKEPKCSECVLKEECNYAKNGAG